MDCVFPFTIGNKTYYDCTTPEREIFNYIETDVKYKDSRICATTNDFNRDKKYKFCYTSQLNTTAYTGKYVNLMLRYISLVKQFITKVA